MQRIEHVFVREGEDVDFEDEDQDIEALRENIGKPRSLL